MVGQLGLANGVLGLVVGRGFIPRWLRVPCEEMVSSSFGMVCFMLHITMLGWLSDFNLDWNGSSTFIYRWKEKVEFKI